MNVLREAARGSCGGLNHGNIFKAFYALRSQEQLTLRGCRVRSTDARAFPLAETIARLTPGQRSLTIPNKPSHNALPSVRVKPRAWCVRWCIATL